MVLSVFFEAFFGWESAPRHRLDRRRRALLKTTAIALVGWIAVAVAVSARFAVAEPVTCMSRAWLGAALMGQATSASNVVGRQGTTNGRPAARRAKRWPKIIWRPPNALITRAEALGVQYNAFHIGDTPKKARRDLERKRGESVPQPAKPSQMFAPLGLNKNNKSVPMNDPFAGRTAEPPPAANPTQIGMPQQPGSDTVQSLTAAGAKPMQRPVDDPYRINEPGEERRPAPGMPGRNTMLARCSGQCRPPCRSSRLRRPRPVRSARRVWRWPSATYVAPAELVQQARSMRVNYQPLDDSPGKVEAAIASIKSFDPRQEHGRLSPGPTPACLLEQADALLRWGEHDEAERLASRAAGMQVVYGPFEQKPQDMLERHRRHAAGKAAIVSRRRRRRAGLPGGDGVATDGASAESSHGASSPRSDRRRSTGSGRGDRPSSRTIASARVGVCPGRGSSGAGVVRSAADSFATRSGRGHAGRWTTAARRAARTAAPAVYDPTHDPTRNVAASNQQPALSAGCQNDAQRGWPLR